MDLPQYSAEAIRLAASVEEAQRRRDEQAIRAAVGSVAIKTKTRDNIIAVALASRCGYSERSSALRTAQRLRIGRAFARLLAEGELAEAVEGAFELGPVTAGHSR